MRLKRRVHGAYGNLGNWKPLFRKDRAYWGTKPKPVIEILRQWDPSKHKRLLLSLVLLSLIVPGYLWYTDPGNGLFHQFVSQVAKTNVACLPYWIPQAPCNDPATNIWRDTGGSTSLGDFQTSNQPAFFPSSGMCSLTKDIGGGASPTDYATNHKIFFQLGRWWFFYTNFTAGQQGLNYVSVTGVTNSNPTGTNDCDNKVEGIVPNSAVFTSTKTGAEYSVDANSSMVFVEFTPRTTQMSFMFGTLNSNGLVTNWSARTVLATVPTNYIVWNGNDIRWQPATGRLYLMYDNLSGVTNFINSQEYYVVSTDSSLSSFSSPAKITLVAPFTTTHSQDDIVTSTVPFAGGAVYVVYGQFFQQNATGDTDFHGILLNGTTIGTTETIPHPPRLSTPVNLQPSFFYTWQPGPGIVAGNFAYSTNANQTFITDPWYAIRPAGGVWTTPTQPFPDPFLNQLASQLSIFAASRCETYDQTFGEIGAQTTNVAFTTLNEMVSGIVGPTNSTINFLNSTSPVHSPLYNSANDVMGVCPRYSNSAHQSLWGLVNGTNVGNLCNGNTSPCQVLVGLMTFKAQPLFGAINHAAFQTNCSGTASCIDLTSGPMTGQAPSIAITNSSIGDLSPVSSKLLGMIFSWMLTGIALNTNVGWGFYLTTNKTVPVHNIGSTSAYSPYFDPSVFLLANNFCPSSCASSPAGGAGLVTNLYLLKHAGDTIASEDAGCPSGSPFICRTLTGISYGNNTLVDNSYTYLNYTAVTNVNGCTVANGGLILAGGGCSWNGVGEENPQNPPTSSITYGTSQSFPWFQFQSQTYYLGFFVQSGLNAHVRFLFDAQNLPNGGVQSQMNIFYWVPGPACLSTGGTGNSGTQCSSTDTGGFFGSVGHFFGDVFTPVGNFLSPVINPIAGVMNGIVGALVSGLSELAQLLIQGLSLLEASLVTVLNAIGNALGFGNVGTDIQTLINQSITFFTTFYPTIFLNLAALFSRFFDALNIFSPWIAIALSIAKNILALGLNSIGFIISIVTVSMQWIAPSYTWILTFLFFFYVMDDGVGGLIEFFESMQFLIFNIGLNLLFHIINVGLDIFTFLIGLVPKPFIQMSATKIPRLPLFDSTARFVFPRFDMAAIRSGDLFGVLLWMGGIDFWIRYNSATPALPGSLPALTAGTAASMATLAVFLPFLEILIGLFFFVGLSFWGVSRMFMFLAIDAGMITDVTGVVSLGLGTSRASGGHVTGIRKATKHFQRGPSPGTALAGPAELPIRTIIFQDRRNVTVNQPLNVTPKEQRE